MNIRRYTAHDYLALLTLALLALALAASMAWFVTERIPHLEDEITYLFQARTYARGALWAPPPPVPRSFFTPFVLTLNGRRIGKYAIGWPMLLAPGERVRAGWLVNPLLGGLTVALIYALGRDLYDRQIGILAGVLASTSPFFLIQSSTYMSHAASCLWSTLLMWAMLRVDMARDSGGRGRGWALAGGLALGMLALTRALTAAAVFLPFAILLLGRALRRPADVPALVGTYWPMAVAALLVASLQPLYLYIVTGSPTTNLYTMVWPYDRIGFGPGIGPNEGHTLRQALFTARQDLTLWTSELFGWPYASWLFLLPGLVSGVREGDPRRRVWPFLLLAPFVSLVVVYLAYWVGAQVYGPRYYYEGLAGLCLLSALGLRGVVQLLHRGLTRRRRGAAEGIVSRSRLVYGALGALIALNAAVYLPARLSEWHGLYSITRAPIERLEEIRESDRVLVFVRGRHWVQYGALFSLNSPWLDGPVVVAHDISPEHNAAVRELFPEREVWYYSEGSFSKEPLPYPDEGS